VTRSEFIARAVRAAERAIEVPQGFFGVWRDVTNGVVRVRFTRSDEWEVSRAGMRISLHSLREGAIRKASKL
jgi:hypothetical protein